MTVNWGNNTMFKVIAVFVVASLARTYAIAEVQVVPSSTNGTISITILHDNDLHGHLFPFCYTEPHRSSEEMCNVGGAARRATLVKKLRGAAHAPMLLIDSGDVFTRGPLTTTYEGDPDIQTMNKIKYDLAAIGNNEFKSKDGVERQDSAGSRANLLKLVKESRFPWLCANVTDEQNQLLPHVKPFIVKRVGALRVAFIGLTTTRSSTYPQTKGLKFSDPVEAAKLWIPIARKKADILIAVTHLGITEDKMLVQHSVGIDAVLGGDSHTFLYNEILVKDSNGREVPIVQDGEFGVNLGKFDFDARRGEDGSWTLVSSHDELIPVSSAIAEDVDVMKLLSRYKRPSRMQVAQIDLPPKTASSRFRQTAVVIARQYQLATQSDIGIQLGDELYDIFRSASIAPYDVYQALPFENNVVIARMTGHDLSKEMTRFREAVCAGACTQIEPLRIYRVAMLDVVAKGMGIPDSQLSFTGRDSRELVISSLENESSIGEKP